MEDKADVDMDTEAPQVSHKPGGEPKIKVNIFSQKCGDTAITQLFKFRSFFILLTLTHDLLIECGT